MAALWGVKREGSPGIQVGGAPRHRSTVLKPSPVAGEGGVAVPTENFYSTLFW